MCYARYFKYNKNIYLNKDNILNSDDGIFHPNKVISIICNLPLLSM